MREWPKKIVFIYKKSYFYIYLFNKVRPEKLLKFNVAQNYKRINSDNDGAYANIAFPFYNGHYC